MSDATHTAHEGHDGHGGDHHDESFYIKIWGLLLGLLVVSVLGPEVGKLLGPGLGTVITLITAFGIAFVKAYMVIKHFMHLNTEKPIVHYMLSTALVFMVLMFAGIAGDVMEHEGSRWENIAAKAEVERVQKLAAEGKLDGHHDEGHHGDDAHHGAEAGHGDAAHHDDKAHGDDGHGGDKSGEH